MGKPQRKREADQISMITVLFYTLIAWFVTECGFTRKDILYPHYPIL